MSSKQNQEENGLDTILNMMKSAIENGELNIPGLFDTDKVDIKKLVTDLKKVLSDPDHSADDLNTVIQDSEVGQRIESHNLPAFISDQNFMDSLCSLKIYNRVKFKESLLCYAGDQPLSAAKSLKKRDERELFVRTIIFYGALDESAFANINSMIKTYDLSLEYRFIQFALKAIGIDCPNKYTKFIELSENVDAPLPQTKQLLKLLEEGENFQEDEAPTLKIIDFFFRYLDSRKPEDLSNEEKNGIIAFMSAFSALAKVNLHYLYAVSFGHNWLFEHSQYSSTPYKQDFDSKDDFDVDKVLRYAFDDDGLISKHLLIECKLCFSSIKGFYSQSKVPRFVSLVEYLVINAHCFIADLKDIIDQSDQINALMNMHTKTALHRSLNRITKAIKNLGTCVLIDDSNSAEVGRITTFPDKLNPMLQSIENQYELIPVLESSLGAIAKYSADSVPLLNKKVAELKQQVESCMQSMDMDGAKEAINGLAVHKENFKNTLSDCESRLADLRDTLDKKNNEEQCAKEKAQVDLKEIELDSGKLEQLEKDLLATISDAEEKENKLLGDIAKLESQCAFLTSKLSNQSEGSELSMAMTKVLFQRPSSPKTIDVVHVIQEMFPHVIFADNVLKTAAANIYENPLRLFDYMVRICNDYYPQIRSGVSDSVAKDCLGNCYSRSESDTVMNNEKLRAHRIFKFQHKPVEISKHITIGGRHDKRATIQVYFDVIDGVLYIGYVGEHLPLN